MAGKKKLTGPDFARGVSLAKLLDGGMRKTMPGESRSRFSWPGAAAPASP